MTRVGAARQRVVERELEVGRLLVDRMALDAHARSLGGAHGGRARRVEVADEHVDAQSERRRVLEPRVGRDHERACGQRADLGGVGREAAADDDGARPDAAAGDSTRRVCQDRGVRVVTLGDLLLDVVVRLEAPPATDDDVPAAIALVPGGQAANVAAWVRWLGGEARLVARRADDAAGA